MFRSCRLAPALGLCLAVAASPTLGAEHTLDGTYSGKRVLIKGPAGSPCPAEDNVSVTVQRRNAVVYGQRIKKFSPTFLS